MSDVLQSIFPFRKRAPYIAYLTRCRQGLQTTQAHLERLLQRVLRDKEVANRYFTTVCVRLLLESKEKKIDPCLSDLVNLSFIKALNFSLIPFAGLITLYRFVSVIFTGISRSYSGENHKHLWGSVFEILHFSVSLSCFLWIVSLFSLPPKMWCWRFLFVLN